MVEWLAIPWIIQGALGHFAWAAELAELVYLLDPLRPIVRTVVGVQMTT